MKSQSNHKEWLKRARSNLEKARIGKISEGILYEDLCFDCQQSVEKSLKGLLVYIGAEFPKTHSISRLIELIEDNDIDVPENIKDSIILTDYAVNTRYPGSQEIVDEKEFMEALEITEKVFYWVKQKIEIGGY
jgi:HEPN domain-containing protein